MVHWLKLVTDMTRSLGEFLPRAAAVVGDSSAAHKIKAAVKRTVEAPQGPAGESEVQAKQNAKAETEALSILQDSRTHRD